MAQSNTDCLQIALEEKYRVIHKVAMALGSHWDTNMPQTVTMDSEKGLQNKKASVP